MLACCCAACRNCKGCKIRAEFVSFTENDECQAILNGLTLDKKQKKWAAFYPFCISPWILIDN
jgi:hypothetical protein